MQPCQRQPPCQDRCAGPVIYMLPSVCFSCTLNQPSLFEHSLYERENQQRFPISMCARNANSTFLIPPRSYQITFLKQYGSWVARSSFPQAPPRRSSIQIKLSSETGIPGAEPGVVGGCHWLEACLYAKQRDRLTCIRHQYGPNNAAGSPSRC